MAAELGVISSKYYAYWGEDNCTIIPEGGKVKSITVSPENGGYTINIGKTVQVHKIYKSTLRDCANFLARWAVAQKHYFGGAR